MKAAAAAMASGFSSVPALRGARPEREEGVKKRRRSRGAAEMARLLLAVLLLLAGAVSVVYAQQAGGVAPMPGPVPASAPGGVWDQAARVIVLPWMTIALLVVGCLLLFIDLLTPLTWGVTGTLGVLSVALVFAAHITAGTGGWVGIILFLGGLVFLLLETHVFPGHGIAAVAGLLLLFLGMFWSLGGSKNAAFALGVSTVLTIVSLIAFFAYLPKSPVWKKLGQEMRQRSALGYVTSDDYTPFLGRTGRALTVLRPSGAAEIDGIRLDVITEGDFLEAGMPVMVIRVEGARIVVDNLAAGDASAAAAAQTRAA